MASELSEEENNEAPSTNAEARMTNEEAGMTGNEPRMTKFDLGFLRH